MVMGITRKDFEDMCAIRIRIEGLAVRGFIANMTEDGLRELREAIDFQEFYLSKSDADQLRIMDSRFHDTIYNRCGSMILRDTLAPLHKKVQKFRRQSMQERSRAVKSVEEHKAIYEAIAAKQPDLAEKLMIEHVDHALKNIIEKEL